MEASDANSTYYKHLPSKMLDLLDAMYRRRCKTHRKILNGGDLK
jgi:hypothetical protein